MKKYDFGFNWNGNVKEHFVECLKVACRKRHLSFIWISDENIKDVIKKAEKEGWLDKSKIPEFELQPSAEDIKKENSKVSSVQKKLFEF